VTYDALFIWRRAWGGVDTNYRQKDGGVSRSAFYCSFSEIWGPFLLLDSRTEDLTRKEDKKGPELYQAAACVDRPLLGWSS
jgi:hypothetical protein